MKPSVKCRKRSAAKAYRTFSSVTMVHSSPRVNLNSLQKTMDLSILHHPHDIHNPWRGRTRCSDLKSDPEQDERRISRSAVVQEHSP